MRYVVAGHLPMPILKTEMSTLYLEGCGKPVGIFKDVSWQIYECDLPAQFMLSCFSDGILEVLDDENLQQKESSLLAKVASAAGGLDSVCDTLAIKDIRDNPDDIAVLTISRGLN
jgi:phosphoserine phosphatase RsbU/P